MKSPFESELPLNVAGYRGWYTSAGSGPPIVILASPIGRAKSYRPTVERLCRLHRVITIELPGSGRSSRLPKPWDLSDYAYWASEALNSLAVRDATVVGHSYSGAIPVVMAARHHNHIGRIAIVDGIGVGAPHSFVRTTFGRAIDATMEWDLILSKWHHVAGNALSHPRNFTAMTSESLNADVTADAALVRVPALVAWGGCDHILPPRLAIEYARRLPNATLYISPKGAHEWMIYRPAEFADVLIRFVRGELPDASPTSAELAACTS